MTVSAEEMRLVLSKMLEAEHAHHFHHHLSPENSERFRELLAYVNSQMDQLVEKVKEEVDDIGGKALASTLRLNMIQVMHNKIEKLKR